ncbi:MAG: hypothetical protein RBG13Loki_1465 [Promethearchaeota archaeon CR_4]|nr:MAG: hypothetical protein RBG13Loki_1465 [Candidatus Lokiarchaeota archaeon CR_4]
MQVTILPEYVQLWLVNNPEHPKMVKEWRNTSKNVLYSKLYVRGNPTNSLLHFALFFHLVILPVCNMPPGKLFRIRHI